MKNQFEWLETKTEYREVRTSKQGDELRWLINRETILNCETGETVTRGTLRHPGICVIVPFLEADRIVLMRQYRYAAGQALWELPAGTLEGREETARMVAVESPEECARRELLEETGYRAGHIDVVGEFHSSPGMVSESFFFVRALDLVKVSDGGGVEGENIIVHRVPMDGVKAFMDAKLLMLLGPGLV